MNAYDVWSLQMPDDRRNIYKCGRGHRASLSPKSGATRVVERPKTPARRAETLTRLSREFESRHGGSRRVRYEEHRARIRADECSQDPGAPSFPETSEPTAGLDVTPAPQVTSEERGV